MTTITKLGKVTTDENPALSQDMLFVLPDQRPATRDATIEIKKLVPKESGRAPTAEQRASFINHGIIERLIVAPRDDGRYDIIEGRRRFLVAREIGYERLRCQIIESGEPHEIALTTTGTRLDNPVNEYLNIRHLMEHASLSPQMISAVSGMPLKLIEKRVKLARLIPAVWEYVESGAISVAVGMSMTSLPESSQELLMTEVFDKKGRITPADVSAEKRRIAPATGNQAGLGGEFAVSGSYAADDPGPDGGPSYAAVVHALRLLVHDSQTFKDSTDDETPFDPASCSVSTITEWVTDLMGSSEAFDDADDE